MTIFEHLREAEECLQKAQVELFAAVRESHNLGGDQWISPDDPAFELSHALHSAIKALEERYRPPYQTFSFDALMATMPASSAAGA